MEFAVWRLSLFFFFFSPSLDQLLTLTSYQLYLRARTAFFSCPVQWPDRLSGPASTFVSHLFSIFPYQKKKSLEGAVLTLTIETAPLDNPSPPPPAPVVLLHHPSAPDLDLKRAERPKRDNRGGDLQGAGSDSNRTRRTREAYPSILLPLTACSSQLSTAQHNDDERTTLAQ